MALTTTQVSELYVSIFNRASETDGNAYWAGLNASAATIAQGMLDTTDAATYFGTSLATNQLFVEHIYLNTLNKTVADDATGIAYWVDLLDAGTTRGAVVAGLVAAVADYSTSTDAATIVAYNQFTNRVAVSDYTADTLATAPADYATSTSFSGSLTVTDDIATVTTAQTSIDAANPANVGQTFSLTTDGDNITGTALNDSFNGILSGALAVGSTIQPGDQIDGGAGTDTLNFNISANAGAAFTIASVSTTNVEKVYASNYDINAGDSTIDAAAMTGLTTVGLTNSSATGDTIFTNLLNSVEADAKGAGDLTVVYDSTVVEGASDTQVFNLNTYTGSLFVDEVETITLNTTGKKSTLAALDTDGGTQVATTLNITGDQTLVITADLETDNAALTAIDGSAATGNTTFETDDTGTLSIKLGAGDDTLIREHAATTITVDAGEGVDTLKVDDGTNVTAAKMVNFSNFEILELTNNAGATAIDLDGLSMFTTIVNSDDTGATSTINNAAANTALSITVAGGNDENTTLSLKDDTATDSINVTIGAATGTTAVSMGTLTLANHETINIETVSGATNTIAALTSADATLLNVTGEKNLTVTAFTSSTNLETIDASAMTGNFVMSAALVSTDATTITTGSGDDTILAKAAADTTIVSNDGDDQITGNSGDDTITSGAGDDVITSVEGDDTIDAGAGNDIIDVNDFSDLDSSDSIDGGEGTDALRFSENIAHDLTTATILTGISNIESYTFSALNNKVVTINDTVMNDGAVTIEFTSGMTVDAASTLNASGVLTTSSTINFTDNSTAGNNVYTLSNAIDNASMGVDTDTFGTDTLAYLTATDTLNGGAGADTLAITQVYVGTTTITEAQLAGMTSVETININTSNNATTDVYSLTITDAVVANQINSGETMTLTRDASDTGKTTFDASAVTADYKMALNGGAAADVLTGGAGADTIDGGAGNDTLTGGTGIDTFVFDVAATNGNDDITDFNWGTTTTGSTTVDLLDLQALATLSWGADLFDTVQKTSTSATIGADTDVIIIDTESFASEAALNTAITTGGDYAISGTDDTLIFWQDSLGNVNLTFDTTGATTGGGSLIAHFSNAVSITGIADLISIDDFVVA